MDDQQRAREPQSSCLQEMLQHMRKRGWIGADIESLILTHAAMDATALRAAPEVPAARVAELDGLESLSLIEHVRRLAETQGAHVRYWAEAYGVQAKEPHFQGHGVVAGLLAEYADLLERLAGRPQGVK